MIPGECSKDAPTSTLALTMLLSHLLVQRNRTCVCSLALGAGAMSSKLAAIPSCGALLAACPAVQRATCYVKGILHLRCD